MRLALFFLLVSSTLLAACNDANTDATLEHGSEAGAHGYRDTTVFCVNADGLLIEAQKKLPWQTGMESYALSFVLENAKTQYSVTHSGSRATVDITDFPAFPTQATEAAAIAGIVNTMLAFSDANEVTLTFRGESVETLPHGTQANTIFTEPIMVDARG